MPRTHRRSSAEMRGFMFDVDGTLLLSDRSLGALRSSCPAPSRRLNELRARGVPYRAAHEWQRLSTGASRRRNCATLGLPVDDAQMITPSNVAADLMTRNGVKRALVLGTEGVGYCLREAGIDTLAANDPKRRRRRCRVRRLASGLRHEGHRGGLQRDLARREAVRRVERAVLRDEAGPQRSAIRYAIVAAIRAITRAPMILTGKPSMHAMRFVAQRLGVRPSEVARGRRRSAGRDRAWRGAPAALRSRVTTGTTSAERVAATATAGTSSASRSHQPCRAAELLAVPGALIYKDWRTFI